MLSKIEVWKKKYEECKLKEPELHAKITKTIKFIQSLNYNFSISWNGGKDITVTIALFILAKNVPSDETLNPLNEIPAIYFNNDSFDEITQFVEKIKEDLNLKLFTSEKSYKEGLKNFLETYPSVNAILMGIRPSDPNGDIGSIKLTDAGWPPLLRINPLIDANWSYSDIWKFIRFFDIPYCSLYDQGYTSLGEKTKTQRNPHIVLPESISNIDERKNRVYNSI
jgi:FAD synthetase